MGNLILPGVSDRDPNLGALNQLLKGGFPMYDHLPIIAGLDQYFTALGPHASSATAATQTVDVLRLFPFFSVYGGRIDKIAFFVDTVGGAGAKARVGIYDSDPVTRHPNRLFVDGGEFDTNASTGLKATTINLDLQPMTLYWFASLYGTAVCTVKLISGGTGLLGWLNDGVSRVTGATRAQAYGALPATLTALTSGELGTTGITWIGVRYAA